MQVVLLERIPRLGQMGDVVDVKAGFARNFLLPQNKALRATKANLERFEKDRAEIEARDLERKKEAEGVHKKLDGKQFVVLRQSGATGQLYGSVTSRDVAGLLADENIKINRGQVTLGAIKTLGVHEAQIMLHPDVQATITINVARSEEEAERQSKGETVISEAPNATPVETDDSTEMFEEGFGMKEEAEEATEETITEENKPTDENETEVEKA